MPILAYDDEHEIFRASLRRFFEREVLPQVDDWERAGIVPREAWRKMGAQGYLCPQVPEAYGGLGADFLYSVIVTEELTRTNHAGLAAPLHSDVVVPYLIDYAGEQIKRAYLPGCVSGECITAIAMTEPDAGSDLAAMRTSVVERDGELIIDGQKTFISNGINCDLLVLAARDKSIDDAHRAIDLIAVPADAPGFIKGQPIAKVGWHSQDTAELFFEGCRVPVANRLGAKGAGFELMMQKLAQERLVCALWAVAAAEHMLELTIDYCKQRRAFGRPIAAFQNTQFELVEMSTEVKLGRCFVDKLIAEHMAGGRIALEVAQAKYWTTEMAKRVADRCVQLHGGYGYCEEYPIARAWRDVRVMSIFAGTNEIMKGIAAKFMGL